MMNSSIIQKTGCIILSSFILLSSIDVQAYSRSNKSTEITDLLTIQSPKPKKRKTRFRKIKKVKESMKERALESESVQTVETYEYDKNSTYKIKLSTFISTVISLPKDEKIITYKLGDSDNFHVHHDSAIPNILTINVLQDGFFTNLLIITDKQKIYNLYLKSYKNTKWIVPHFTYYIKKNKEELKAELLKTLKSNNQDISDVDNLDKLNTSYSIKGDKDIAPLYVYDDGKFTYIDFGDNFISDRFPTVYKVVDKKDSVVNNHTRGNLIVVESLSTAGFILKNGDKYVCIKPKKKLREVYKNVR